MTYPAVDLYPSDTTYPGALSVDFGGYSQVVTVALGSLTLTATDADSVDWLASSVEGWDGSPGSSMTVTAKTRAPGGWASSARNLTSRTLTVAGFVQAGSPVDLRAAVDRLTAAASLYDTLLSVSEDGDTRSCIVARQGDVLVTRINATAAQWSVGLVAADPRKFAPALAVATGLPSSTGGMTVPTTVPTRISSTVASGIAQLTNRGNAAGPVRVRFDGPLVSPVVTHTETGLSLATNLTVPSGQYVVIDMEAQTVLAQGQASRNQNVTSRGWMPFLPGVNRYGFSATSGSGQMTVIATPSWL